MTSSMLCGYAASMCARRAMTGCADARTSTSYDGAQSKGGPCTASMSPIFAPCMPTFYKEKSGMRELSWPKQAKIDEAEHVWARQD